MAHNEVRIIGGKWRGRKLRFPDSVGLRPTLGRVRGSLFNWLAAKIHGASCLDLFAGSGALGFEALSRGAAEVVLVERSRRVADALTHNAALLDANARVIRGPAIGFLGKATGAWDLIFLDPPFKFDELDAVLDLVVSRQLLAAGGLVYFERKKKQRSADAEARIPADPPSSSGWRILKQSHAGDCRFGLLARD